MPNQFLKLPFFFEEDKLLVDLSICREHEWVPHFNEKDYSGKWTSISLRSLTGREKDIHAHSGSYKDTPLLQKCPYFSYILSLFRCRTEAVRLLSLAPGGVIKEHRDIGLSYRQGLFRLHIPLETSQEVSFLIDKETVPMKAGECWYADFDLPHSVVNHSGRERVHLIIDGLRNEWSDGIFREAGYQFPQEHGSNKYDPETLEKMIEALKLMNTDSADEWIQRLRVQAGEEQGTGNDIYRS